MHDTPNFVYGNLPFLMRVIKNHSKFKSNWLESLWNHLSTKYTVLLSISERFLAIHSLMILCHLPCLSGLWHTRDIYIDPSRHKFENCILPFFVSHSCLGRLLAAQPTQAALRRKTWKETIFKMAGRITFYEYLLHFRYTFSSISGGRCLGNGASLINKFLQKNTTLILALSSHKTNATQSLLTLWFDKKSLANLLSMMWRTGKKPFKSCSMLFGDFKIVIWQYKPITCWIKWLNDT